MIHRSALALAVLSLSCALADAQERDQKFTLPHITVTGTSFVEVRPDIATLSLGVVNERPTAAEAESENARAAASAIAGLKEFGVDPKDIKTSSLVLAPVMVEERDPKTNGVVKRTLTGYRAENGLTVTIRDVDKAGAIASRVAASGANFYRGLYFSVSDKEAREDGLRAAAVKEAMRKAALYSHGAATKLGRLLAIEPNPEFGAANLPMQKSSDGPRTVVVPVEPGNVRIESTVSATWELVPE
jgi:uncharacterized protein YggE